MNTVSNPLVIAGLGVFGVAFAYGQRAEQQHGEEHDDHSPEHEHGDEQHSPEEAKEAKERERKRQEDDKKLREQWENSMLFRYTRMSPPMEKLFEGLNKFPPIAVGNFC